MKEYNSCIISDMFGWAGAVDLEMHQMLQLDSRQLAGLDPDGDDVHSRFVGGGIDRAAEALLEYSCNTLIGFSVGGVIAWRAALLGMKCNRVIAISATRLRYEVSKPDCEIALIYGENDPFRPKNEWFKNLGVNFRLMASAGHEVYKNLKSEEYEI